MNTPDVYTLARLQRMELVIKQQEAKIRDLEDRCFRAEAALAAAEHIHGVPA